MNVLKEELFSKVIKAGTKRTFFIDVKESKNGSGSGSATIVVGGNRGGSTINPKNGYYTGVRRAGGNGLIEQNQDIPSWSVNCDISLSVTPGNCNQTNNQYSVTGTMTFSNAPITGTLTVSIGAEIQMFNAPFTSPQSYILNGLISDVARHPCSAVISADANCTNSVSYTAPINCAPAICTSTVTATSGTCNPANNQYTVTGQVTLTNPSNSGTVTVQIVGGGSQTFTLPQTSPISYSIAGQTADGASHIVDVTISGVSCASTTTYTAPVNCIVNCPSPNCGLLKSKKVINN